jgi:hypothetical protein
LDAGADEFGAGDLTAGAELLAVADGAGLPDDVEPDAKAAAGRAITAAAMTPATARRRLGTGMTRSFVDRIHASPAAPPKTDRPVTLKEPKKPGAARALPLLAAEPHVAVDDQLRLAAEHVGQPDRALLALQASGIDAARPADSSAAYLKSGR